MEVFPLEDVGAAGDVGGPAVSQVEQMQSWDDSFTQLEKALQAAYETKEAKTDISSFTRQIPASLTVSTSRPESSTDRLENKRKWGDIYSPDTDESSRLKFKRTAKLLPGGVTITLLESPKENSDVSDTVRSLVSDVKDSEKAADIQTCQPNSQNNNHNEDVFCNIQEVENPLDHISSSDSNLFENENHGEPNESKNTSHIPAGDGIKENPILFESKNYSPGANQDSDFQVNKTDDSLTHKLQKDSVTTDTNCDHVKNVDNDVATEVSDSSIWDSILQENKEHSDIKNQTEDFPKPLEKVVNFQTTSDDDTEKTGASTQLESNLEQEEQAEKCSTKEEQSEKSNKKDDSSEKNSKKDEKLKKKKFERCNIRDIKLEDELDAVTLSAQKEEQERIKRLQEAQMRALQERLQIIEVEKEALTQLFSQPATDDDPALFNSTSHNSEASEEIDDKSKIPLIKSETDVILLESSDDDKKRKLEEIIPAPSESEENIIDISSSSSEGASDSEDDLEKKDDDIMVLSDDGGDAEAGPEDPNNSGAHTNDCFNLPDHEGRVLVNVGHPPEDPDIFLAPQIAKVIKPHQIGGIRFLYDNVVENLERYKSSTGFGCILAHSMGLGKTVQVVSFVDVFLRHTPATLVLCIVPINTIQNWKAEFDMWVPPVTCVENEHVASGDVRPRDYNIYTLNENFKTMAARAALIAEWRKEGGVLLMGYEMYRMLALRKMPKIPLKKGRRLKKQEVPVEPETCEQIKKFMDQMYEHIVIPGPDLVICDEGHRIKNSLASTSMALKSIKTRRRVVLTGYPLQNNLLEYWCMVDFVRPNYLGSRAEFCNMFERPISNGQCIDSTPRDRQLMRFRSHVLHSLLVGFVQRRGHSVLRAVLPKKEEHVLLIRMTPIQRKLYKCFVKDLLYVQQATNPLKLFAVCCKIWNHPDILYKLLQEKRAQEDIDLDIDLNPSSAVSSNALIKKKTKEQMKSKMLQRPLKCSTIKMSTSDLKIPKTELLSNSGQTCKMLGQPVTIKTEGQISENVHLNQQNSQLLEMSQDSKSPLCKEEYPLSLHSSGTQSSQNSHVTIKQESTHQFSHVQYSPNNSAFCQQGFSQSSSLQPCQPQLQNTPQYAHQSQNQQYSSASQQPFQQQFMNSSLPQAQYMHQSQNAFSQLRNNYGQQSNGPPQGGNQPYPQPADNSPQIGNSQQFPQNTDIPSPSLNNQYSQVLNESGTGTNNKNCSQPPNGSVNNNNQFPQPSGRSKIATKLYPIPSSRPTQMGNNQFSQSGNCSSQGGNHFSPTSNISTRGGNNQQFPLQPAGTSELANNQFAQSVSVSPQLPNNPQYPQTSCGSSDTGNFASSSHVSTAVGSSQLYTQPNSGSSQEVSNPQFSQSPSGSSQMTNKQFPLQQSSVPQVGGNQPYSQSSDNSSQVGNNQAYPSTAAASSQVGANQQFSQHSSSSQVGNNPQFPQPCTEQSQIANNQPQIGNNQQFPQQLNEPSQIGSNHQFPQTCNEQPQIGNNLQYSQQSNEQSQISNTQQCTQLPDGASQTGNGQLYHQQLNESSQVLTERPFSSQHPFSMQTNSQGESNFSAQSTNQDNLHQKLSQFSSPNNSQYTQQQFPSPGNQSQISFNQESVNPTCPIKPLPHISINSQSNFNQKTKSQYIKHSPQQQYSPQSVAQTQQYAPNQLRQHGQQSQQIQKYNEQISSQHKPFSDKHEVQPQYTEQAGGEVQQCHDNTKNHQKYPDHSVVQQAFIQHSPSQSQYSQRPQTQPSRTQQTYSQTSATLDVLPPFSHPSPNQKLPQQSPPQHFTQQPSPQYNQQSSPMQTYSQCSPLQQQFPQQSPPLQPSPSQSQYSLPSPTQQTYPQFPQQSSNASQYLPQSSHQYPQESSPQQQYSQTQYNSQSSSQQYPQHSSPQQQFQQQSPKQTYGQFLQHGQQYPRQPSPHQNYLQQPRQPPFHMTHQQQYNQNVQPYKSNLNTSNFTPQSPGQGSHYNSSQVGNSHQYGSQQQQQLPSRQSFPGPHSLSDPYSLQIPQSNSPQVFNQQPLRNSSPQYCQSSQPTTGTFAQPSSPPSPSYSQQSQQCHQNKQYQQPFMQQNAQSFQQYQPQLPQSMQPPQKMHSSMQLKNTKQPLSKNGKSLSHVNLNCQTVQPQLLDHSADAVQNPQYPNFQNNLQQNQAQHFSQTTKTVPNASNQNYQQIHESSVKNEHFAAENIKEEANVSFASKSSKAVMIPAKTQTTTPQTNVLPYQQVQAQENCKIENDTPGVSETSIVPCRERIDSSISYEWAIPLMKDYVLGVLENSHKIMVLFAIIDQTLEKGDKLLVFSQSLSTLDLLEHFLGKVKVPKCYSEENNLENWCRNKNYFRLDGSTSAQEREKLINEFNRNENVSLFLLSTRAGCLGINLVGANRIVVMDASWNPCHDAQAVCRIYRYGQKKQCHIYRLVTDNSLEKRIYDRQVNKQGMSDRVVDELNPESNFTWKDVTTLIQDDEDDGPIQELIKFESSYSDDVLKYLVSKMGPSLSKEPFEHESLLLDRKDLKLTKQEKRMAKQSYEQAKRQNMINIRTTYTYMPGGGQFIINNKQGQWVGGTTVRVLPGQPRGGGRPGTTATPITASPSLMNSLFKQGVMVQKLTIPSNISIPVLTPGAPPVVIPAGQDVLVLRTPKGVYLRLPDGRIIAVQLPPSLLAKTQFRPNVVTHFRPTVPKGNQSVSNNTRGQSIGIIKQTLQCGGTVRLLGPKNASNAPQSANRSSAPEIIDLSDDEEPSFKRGNLSNASDETDSSASEQDQNCNKQSTPVLPGKQITIRRVSPALQQNSVQLSNAKDKCDLPMKLQQNQQITIMPINTNVQQNRQKLAPQLAQPVRVQQMLLQPQQGKRKSLPKSTTKIHMASYPVNKSFQKQQITVTPTQNVVQIQKLKQSPVHQPPLKALNNGDQTLTISSNLKNSNTSVSVSESSEKSESHSDSNIPVEHTKCSIDNKDLSMSPVTSTNQEKLPSNSSSVTVTPLSVTVPLSSSHLKSMSSSSQIIEKRPALLPQSCENIKSLQQPVPVSSVENLHIHSSNFTQLSSPSMTISQLPQTTSNLVHSNTTSPITSQASQINSKLHQQTFVDSQCLETKAHNIGSSPPQQNSFQLPKVSDLCSSSEKQICRSPSKLSQVSPPHHIIDKVSQLPTQFTETTTPQNTSAVPNLQALKSQVDTKVDAIETSTLNSPKNLQSEMMTMQRNPCAPHAQLSPHCFEDTQNGQINSETYMQQQPQQQLPHFHHHSGLRPPLISSQTQQQTPTKRKKSTNRSTAKKSQQIHTPLNVQGSRQNPISETHQFPYTPLSEHLHDHHFQPFSHPLQNSDFPPFQSYATHKNLLHIQHPQPLHPLQHNQEHSLASHLSHMPHIYPMSSHMTGNPCISDIQPQGPCAWPVPQSSMSSFHPFGQSSQYYSSSHDSQYPFQPSSFSLSQPTSSHVPQVESNAGVLDHVSSACPSEL